jgi:hypothetical protein
MNVLLHTSQQYGPSPPHEHSCPIRSLCPSNALLHTLHEYGCSLVSIWSCSFQVPCQKHKGYTLGHFLIGNTWLFWMQYTATDKTLTYASETWILTKRLKANNYFLKESV